MALLTANPVAGDYDYDRSRQRQNLGGNLTQVKANVFKWLPRKGGGLKRSPAIKTLRGPADNPRALYREAVKYIDELRK